MKAGLNARRVIEKWNSERHAEHGAWMRVTSDDRLIIELLTARHLLTSFAQSFLAHGSLSEMAIASTECGHFILAAHLRRAGQDRRSAIREPRLNRSTQGYWFANPGTQDRMGQVDALRVVD